MFCFPASFLFCFRQLLQRGTEYIDSELSRVSFSIDYGHFLVLVDAKIPAVSEYLFFRSLRQVRNRRCVVYAGFSRFDLVDQSGIPVYADMPLVSELSLNAHLDLMSIPDHVPSSGSWSMTVPLPAWIP